MTATSTAMIAYEPTGRPARAAWGAAASGVVEGRGGAVPTGVGLTGAADTLPGKQGLYVPGQSLQVCFNGRS